jgi:hypothetical protein
LEERLAKARFPKEESFTLRPASCGGDIFDHFRIQQLPPRRTYYLASAVSRKFYRERIST